MSIHYMRYKEKRCRVCWECAESKDCQKWKAHQEAGAKYDSFKCYQKLSADIQFVRENGFEEYKRLQDIREEILKDMLANFNEGRSKSYYCIAATVLEIEELKKAINKANEKSKGLDLKSKSKVLHAMLDEIAKQKGYLSWTA